MHNVEGGGDKRGNVSVNFSAIAETQENEVPGHPESQDVEPPGGNANLEIPPSFPPEEFLRNGGK